jgi:uncharacterized heparinase superfamily protein
MERARRFLSTVAYLRPIQIWGRLWFRVSRPKSVSSNALAVRSAHPAPLILLRWREPRLSADGTFSALRLRIALKDSGETWNDPALPKLWLYNLHYFDDLVAVGAATREPALAALLRRWIGQNPQARGNGWEPYCLSLRIVNWIKWFSGHVAAEPEWQRSLAIQARYLRRRLEWHLLGNHLWANAKALVFAGLYFEGTEADAWRRKGLEILAREFDEQVLEDGGHFERSPMYHAILLEDVLDLVAQAQRYPGVIPSATVERWQFAAGKMLAWLGVMTHPDGDIALFNDAALGGAARFDDLRGYAAALGIESATRFKSSVLLSASGYARLDEGSAALIADVGEIGPDYLPGHAHADTLSYELSLSGQRLIVDAGTSRYDVSAERLWQRGTAAHNTVQIDGRDSSEVWSSFRVGRRARPLAVRMTAGKVQELTAAHDGYRHLKGRPIHHRCWRLSAESLTVEDRIEGGRVQAISRIRLHPAWQAHLDGPGTGWLRLGTRRVRWNLDGACDAKIVQSSWHPHFGVSESCHVLEWRIDGDQSKLHLNWGD